jgi:hypothetical protein
MKDLSVLVLALLVPVALQASQRVMVIEDVTATWCTYCPGAARGIEELDFRSYDSVVPVAYHASSSDPYYTTNSAARLSYYAITGYPTVVLDGLNKIVGGEHTGTMYPTYLDNYRTRITVASPLTIVLSITYDTTSRQGQLTIKLRNTSTGSVSGQLHTVLTESHIYYPWQGMDSLHYVERTMLPNASGEVVTIAAGDSLTKTRDFTVSPSWVASHCDFVIFVQNNSSKEMYQGARIAIINVPELEYYGYQPANPVPNSDVDLTVGLRNMGTGEGQGIAGTLSTTDPYVTVTTANADFPNIPAAASAYSATAFWIHVADNCPDPHMATMNLQVTATGAPTADLSFPLNVTTTYGFADNMEHGQGSWSHSGTRDGWHQSTYRSNSPTHSWYCGIESNHQYNDENDAWLMTPYFTLGTDTVLSFEHYYALELNYDYGLVEINNGSEFWRALTSYTGSSSGWQHVDVALGQYRGQTVRLRCRFISDGNTVAEGWYIDDFEAGAVVGVSENPGVARWRVAVSSNPVRTSALLNFQFPAGSTGGIAIYDVNGRLVRHVGRNLVGNGRIDWNLTDADGAAARDGTYFVRLITTSGGATSKLVVAR